MNFGKHLESPKMQFELYFHPIRVKKFFPGLNRLAIGI